MKRTLCLMTALLLFAASLGTWAQKPRIAVIKIANDSPYGAERLGPAIADWLVQDLVQSGKFRVMERKDLDKVLAEQSLSLSGAVDAKTAVQVGKLLGCQLVVLGAVTDFSKHKSGAHGVWGLGFNVGKTTAEGTLNVKMVNVQTAEIVYTGSEKGSHSFAKVDVAGFGGGVDWDESQARQIFEPAVKKIADQIAQRAEAIKDSLGSVAAVEGKIARVSGGKAYINIGRIDGVKDGQTFVLYRAGQPITDPDTGQVLGQDKTRIGTFTVTKVMGDHLAVGVVEGGQTPQVGDIVQPQNK